MEQERLSEGGENLCLFAEEGESFGDKGNRMLKGGSRRGSKQKGWEAGWRLHTQKAHRRTVLQTYRKEQ